MEGGRVGFGVVWYGMVVGKVVGGEGLWGEEVLMVGIGAGAGGEE